MTFVFIFVFVLSLTFIYLKTWTLGKIYADSVLLNKEANAIMIQKVYKNVFSYFFGWQLKAYDCSSNLCTMLVLAFVEKRKWNEPEIQFLLVSPVQRTLIEVHKSPKAIGSGNELKRGSTQRNSQISGQKHSMIHNSYKPVLMHLRPNSGCTSTRKWESVTVSPCPCSQAENWLCTHFKKPAFQHYTIVYEKRTKYYFLHNTIKHHAQLFLRLSSWIHCADGSVVMRITSLKTNEGIDMILPVFCVALCVSISHLFFFNLWIVFPICNANYWEQQ